MAPGFRHEALFYEEPDEFLAGTVPFIRGGLNRGEPVLVALAEDKIALLEGELGADAEAVEFVDMAPLGRNPARIIPVWREFVARADEAGLSMRGIGEPAWSGRSPQELCECDHHESLLNLAFADTQGFTLLCPYDAAALDDEVLDAARRNHPLVVENGESQASDAYLAPELAPAPLQAPLPPIPAGAAALSFGDGGLPLVRAFVCEHAGAAGIEGERMADFVLAVNELASNSMLHGGGEGTLRAWRDELAVHCEVEDTGRLDDPLLGRTRPTPAQEYGRGLWLVHQLCDLVQLRSGPGGTVARVSMARA
jgi:anti-sigma regulatory factor (Ser/Thr protein kinase)